MERRSAPAPVDDGRAVAPEDRTLPGMSIEIQALEVHALAATLRDTAGEADWVWVGLADPPPVGGPLQSAAEAFVDSSRTAGRALAGELRWLGSTIAAAADSWTSLDAVVVPPAGRLRPA